MGLGFRIIWFRASGFEYGLWFRVGRFDLRVIGCRLQGLGLQSIWFRVCFFACGLQKLGY